MDKPLAELSANEFEALVEQAIDRRFEVWLTQLMDALAGSQEDGLAIAPDFADSLRRSIEQARSGEGMDLKSFRDQIKQ